jgi:hypothetical protein
LLRKYINFIRGVAINRAGMIGVVLVTSSFITFILLELLRVMGFLTNAYIGLVTYLLFPLLFLIGLILIPIGWHYRKKATGKTTRELLDIQFEPEVTKQGFFGSRIFLTIAILTLGNVVFMGVLSGRMLHFMDGAEFCGTACHKVMNPEWVTYQQSPHARVNCVECHVGEGVGALVNSKLNGLWQIISLTFNLYERPIPTPVRQLRPARETCEKCHWPDKFYGSRVKSIVHYEDDEQSTPRYTTLNLKVDAGSGRKRRGIHWHIAEENTIRYASVNEREKMIWVEARQPDGSFKRFANETNSHDSMTIDEVREMDCVDCHNRATHIYELPESALDQRMALGLVDLSLPFLKREGLAAITSNYPDNEAAMEGIANHIQGFYQRNFPEIAIQKANEIDTVISVLRAVYSRNIHHGMKITWGSYPSHIGHVDDGGCFRCHNDNLVDSEGNNIDYDCTTCHSILAYDENEPFVYLLPPDSANPNYPMHRYLRQEFFEAYDY